MAAHAAVTVHDNLAPSQTRVALRSADDETSGRVDEKFRFVREQTFRQNFLNDVLDAEFFNLRVRHFAPVDFIRVLRGNDDVGNRNRFAVFINDRNLRFRIRAQPRHFAALANLGQFASEPMREHNRRGHQFRRFVARVTEHQALIARALLRGFFALGLARVHALRDVRRLLRHDDVDENFVRVKNVVVVDVADFADRVARDFHKIQFRLRRDFAADDRDVRFHIRFAGDAGKLVLREARVQNRVGNCVCDFVGMPLADGLGRKDVTVAHGLF